MKKILPLVECPITSIPSHANFFSIANLNNQGLQWMYNYYVNIYVKFNEHDEWRDGCKAGFLDWGNLDRNYSNLVKSYFVPRYIVKELFEFIKDSLEHGYYLALRLNQYYLPCSYIYNKYNSLHNTLVNGIDFDKKLVYISDFYEGGKYKTETVDFDDFLLAYNHVEEKEIPAEPDFQFVRTEIQLMKLNESSYYQFSLEHLIALLDDYLIGKDSTGRFFNSAYLFDSFDPNTKQSFIYGIKAMNKMAELFCNRVLGIHNMYMLCDRYKGMVLRLNYLIEEYGISLDEELSIYKGLEQKSRALCNLCLKFNMIQQETLAQKIKQGYEELSQQEEQYLTQATEKIKNYMSGR